MLMNTAGETSTPALEELAFRRQFYLGPEFLEYFPSWKRVRIGVALCLTAHPDLEVCHTSDASRSITLLGYLLDPNNPAAGNSDIVDALLHKLDRFDSFWTHTEELGGRWILIVNDGHETVIFNDAAGLRSVYFHALGASRGGTVCASQPGLIAEKHSLPRNEEALAFIESRGHDDSEVYWFPGNTSLYHDVRALLPNHYLRLGTGTTYRYWPDRDVPCIGREEAIDASARTLLGLMRSAQHRFSLALSLTAGWDSRLMLALSKNIIRNVYCFTLAYSDVEKSRDVTVPTTLLKKLGVPHFILHYPKQVNKEFKRIHQRSTSAPSAAWCADVQILYEQYPQDRVCVTGDVAEIVKCYLRLPAPAQRKVTAEDLAALCRIGTHPFLMKAFEEWLSDVQPRNLNVLDLFCWEQIAGRKQQQIRNEADIAHESFAPLNCRRLLLTLLGTDEIDRQPPEHWHLFIRPIWDS